MDQTARPIIDFASQTAANVQKAVTPPEIKGPLQKNLIKVIFGLLGLVILVELIIGFRTLTASRTQLSSAATIQSMTDPRIVIRPTQTSVKVGQIVEVKALVVTGGKPTDSTDLILHFDPSFLEASASSAIKVGEIYQDYPVAAADPKLGTIEVSGTTSLNGQPFVGIGTFATFTFRALKEGKTALTVDFQKGATADSNVVLSGSSKDILDKVYNGEISIGNSQSSQSSPASCAGYTQYCQTPDGKTGRQLCTQGRKDGGACVFDPALSVSCEVCKVQ